MNNSLRGDLKELNLEFLYGVPVHLTDEMADQILALIESKMPKKLRLSTKHQEYQDGHNDCLDEVKSILRGTE